MSVSQFIFIAIAIAIMIGGAYIAFKSLKDNKESSLDNDPLNLNPNDNTALSQDDMKPTLPQSLKQWEQPLPISNDIPTEKENPPNYATNHFANLNTNSSTDDNKAIDNSINQPPQKPKIKNEPEKLTTKQPAYPQDKDAFSLLANATESITPNVQIFDENQLRKSNYKENSSILDSHIQAQVEQEQNSPLNNAIHTINLMIMPNQKFSSISGQQLLTIIDKYGLKYGAMNMFHRYENINGTGLLWFSMMMMTEDGVFPFDLNSLPNQFMSGLAVFLSLPHPKAKQGFDSMVSLARLFAKELDASVYDDKGQLLTKESVETLQEIAINFGK